MQPKELELDGKVFILHKFPAVAGREIIASYPISAMPKIGDYKINEQAMYKLMDHVSFVKDNSTPPIKLSTKMLIDMYVGDWETLAKIEMAMLEYNCSFFRDGKISTFFENFAQKAQALITKILTDSLQPSSPKNTQL